MTVGCAKTDPNPVQVLCLGITGQDCTTTYVVQTGNNCVGIADTYSITQTTLLANNPNVNQNCTNLYPDEVNALLVIA